MNRLEDLECDVCGVILGTVDAFDLNSSYFYCKECVSNGQAEKHNGFAHKLWGKQ